MMNRFSLFSVVFFLWFSFLGTAQHINFKNITVADGLPQSQVFDIEQDSEGALWLATQGGGVCIYDGKSFKIIDTKNGLPSSYIHAICEHNGKMYIGSDKGLSIVQGNDIVNVPFPGVRKINALEKNGDTLFIGTQNGLFYLIQERVRRYENLPAKGQSISKIIFSGISDIFLKVIPAICFLFFASNNPCSLLSCCP